ncbi:transcriptional antiterminator [Halolactibacillus alkaliphilus]|uniref:Transcriptional antiterminator n=1 Tax=Halolactibacillus alkaliphilus TaxID=442899 RepID=A0A511WYH0_9BACI|nr:PRD domain-containing protein [Halolactibacillus alkaliphilus]GEN55563.1 transcriptional antiterminator [Halolactibacillus alkaliphilus]GGN64010.1 transcriptional antiterminator [Halolactibacillus alkaliphilus]SFO62036.1 transcriptional antiterminator, BglG family [Halolactibacillus alkaliphilus]
MIVLRVFNNNAVVVEFEKENGHKTEAVVIGPGLGFKKKQGDQIDPHHVEKVYYVQSELQNRFLNILNSTEEEHLYIADRVISEAEKLGYEKTTVGIMALTEHISFAIERHMSGITLPNLMLHEIQSFYPKEYEIGEWAVSYIHRKLNINLGQDEAGYITLHILNAMMNHNTQSTVDLLKFVSGTIALIEGFYEIKIDHDLFDKNRLVTHLKFLAQRMFLNKVEGRKDVEDLFNYLIQSNEKHREFAPKFLKYAEDSYNIQLDKGEIVYVLIHITKFIKNDRS